MTIRYHDGTMQRIMVQADETLLRRARSVAADRGVSLAPVSYTHLTLPTTERV